MAETAEERVIKSLKTIEEWAIQGMSEKEMAECLDIGYSTFRKIKRENIALLALLKKCAKDRKEMLEEQVKSVEKSLFERATGYTSKETTAIKVKKEYFNDEGKKFTQEDVEVVEVEKHVPADIAAAKFFLLNRAKQAWQDNPHKIENDKEMLKLRKEEIKRNEVF